jgi:thioredoxin reductase
MFSQPIKKSMKTYDVIVIGAGPAGVSAASYTQRKGLDTLLIYEKFGGQLNYTKELFSNISAKHGENCKELIKRYKYALKYEKVTQKKDRVLDIIKKGKTIVTKTSKNKYSSKTVIVATGRIPQKINLPFDNSVPKSLQNINYFTDYPYTSLKKRKKILIVGGGYVGLDVAADLSRHVQKIYIVERTGELGGNNRRIQEISKKKNIEIFLNTTIKSIKHENKELVIEISNKKNSKKIKIDRIFSATGTKPVSPNSNVAKTNHGEIKITSSRNRLKRNMTSITGIFACGDCVEKTEYGFEPLAIGEGIKVAKTAANFLHKKLSN